MLDNFSSSCVKQTLNSHTAFMSRVIGQKQVRFHCFSCTHNIKLKTFTFLWADLVLLSSIKETVYFSGYWRKDEGQLHEDVGVMAVQPLYSSNTGQMQDKGGRLWFCGFLGL